VRSADPEDLSLSFQVLETARVIYSRHYDGPGKVVEQSAEEAELLLKQQEEEQKSSDSGAAAAAAPAASASAASASASAAAPAAGLEPYSMSQKDIGLALAQTYEILAQWFLEKEDFEKSYSENAKALALSEPWLEPHSRDLSAVHMNLAVCALFDNKPELALDSYKRARSTLELTVKHLKEELQREKENPTPMEDAPAEPTPAAASAASASAAAAAAATPAAEAKKPQTRAEKLTGEVAECVEILDELKERIDDIASQLSLPANEQAMTLVKQNLPNSGNPFAVPETATTAAATSANPFAAAAAANPFAAAAAAAPAAAAAAAPVTQLVPKRKKPAAAAAPAAPAAAAASADEPSSKRAKPDA